MDAALDLVEDVLASLQEKVKQQQQPERKDAETNTAPFHSVLASARRKKQRETSVLINRRPSVPSDRSRSHRHHHREEAAKNKHQNSTQRAQRSKHHGISRHLTTDSLSSRNDTSHESCGPKESNTFQNIPRNSMNTRKSGRHKNNLERLHLESSLGIIENQKGGSASKNILGSSSKRRGNRNGERSSESSSDELSRRRKHRSQVKSQNSQQVHQATQEGGSSDLRFVHNDHQEERNVQSGQFYSTSHRSQKHNRSTPPRRRKTDSVSRQSFAQPTLTSKFRDELSSRKEKEEKENITPFIPCGSKGKSYHVGVIVQQELGRLKSMTPKDLEHLMVPSPNSQELDADDTGSDSDGVTEQTVRRALSNIHQHIALATKRTSKK